MEAVVCTRYGPPEVLQVVEVETPTPADDEILVKIHASTVNSSDWYVRSGIRGLPLWTQLMFRFLVGFTGPRKPILGLILAGEVAETGRAITRFRVGDRVYAFTKFHFGAYAQYTCLKEDGTVAVGPANVMYEEAAALPYGGLMALHYLRRGNIRSGQRVLVYGASGAVGTSAIQLARHFGAAVTAVCGSGNVELVRSLGATAVLDYTNAEAPPAGAAYDLVLDAVGKRRTSKLKVACRQALAPGGTFVSVDDGTPELPAADLVLLREMVEAGTVVPVIDRTYPLERLAEAHRYVETDHKRGNVVITVAH